MFEHLILKEFFNSGTGTVGFKTLNLSRISVYFITDYSITTSLINSLSTVIKKDIKLPQDEINSQLILIDN